MKRESLQYQRQAQIDANHCDGGDQHSEEHGDFWPDQTKEQAEHQPSGGTNQGSPPTSHGHGVDGPRAGQADCHAEGPAGGHSVEERANEHHVRAWFLEDRAAHVSQTTTVPPNGILS